MATRFLRTMQPSKLVLKTAETAHTRLFLLGFLLFFFPRRSYFLTNHIPIKPVKLQTHSAVKHRPASLP